MKDVTDAMLNAYLDGALEPAEASRIAALVASDADLALRLARYRRLDNLLREAAPEVPTTDDDPLVERILGAPAYRSPARWRRHPLTAALAILVAVGAGLVSGLYVHAPTDLTVAGSGLVARGALAAALDRQPSMTAAAQGPVQIALSFRSADHRFCRQFTLRAKMQGLACRDAGDWRILATAEPPSNGGGYRTAGAEDGPVDAAIQAMGGVQALDRAAEADAIRAHWR